MPEYVNIVTSLHKKWDVRAWMRFNNNCSDVIMGVMASQITRLTIVYPTVYSGSKKDQRKRQSSASLTFVQGIRRWAVNSPHKWPVTRKMFPFDDVIMMIKIHKRSEARWNQFIAQDAWTYPKTATWKTIHSLNGSEECLEHCLLATLTWQLFHVKCPNFASFLSQWRHFDIDISCGNFKCLVFQAPSPKVWAPLFFVVTLMWYII